MMKRAMVRYGGRLLAVLLMAASSPMSFGFAQTHVVETEEGSGIRIHLNLPFESSPQSGFIPVQVKIANERNERLSWTFSFTSGRANQEVRNQFSEMVSVGPMQTRETYLFVSRSGLEGNQYSYGNLWGTVSGPGISDRGVNLSSSYRSGGVPTGFVAMSQSLAGDSWSKLETQLKTSTSKVNATNMIGSTRVASSRTTGRGLRGSPVDLRELPPDERALSGVAGLFLKDGDWAALEPALQMSIVHWLHGGGQLIVVSGEEERPALAGLNLPAGTEKIVPMGFGKVEFLRLLNGELPIPEAAAAVIALDNAPFPVWQVDYSPGVWTLPAWVGWPQLNVGLIIGFVCIFAMVIGPINLYWLAPASRRHRLFFTVPALSALASLGLIGVIAIGDGFGGIGGRNVILCLNAGENRLALLQEQVSRSRLLLGRTFKVDPQTQLALIAPEERGNDSREVARGQGGEAGGDWFKSRAVQMHFLKTSMPSRAEVVLVSSDDATKPPTLLSSVPGTLREVFFMDASGRYWHASELPTGRPVVLTASSRKDYEAGMKQVSESLSRSFQVAVEDAAHRPGYFYALAEPSAEWPLATLPSIEWEKETIFAFGPCTQKETK